MNARDAIKVALATQETADTQADFVEEAVTEHLKRDLPSVRIKSHLEKMDDRLLARGGSAELKSFHAAFLRSIGQNW